MDYQKETHNAVVKLYQDKAKQGKAMYIKNTYINRNVDSFVKNIESANRGIHVGLATFEMEIPRSPRGDTSQESFITGSN